MRYQAWRGVAHEPGDHVDDLRSQRHFGGRGRPCQSCACLVCVFSWTDRKTRFVTHKERLERVSHPWREADLGADLCKRKAGDRSELRRLEDDGAAWPRSAAQLVNLKDTLSLRCRFWSHRQLERGGGGKAVDWHQIANGWCSQQRALPRASVRR